MGGCNVSLAAETFDHTTNYHHTPQPGTGEGG